MKDKKRFGIPRRAGGRLGERHTATAQKRADGFDFDRAADNPTVGVIGLENGYHVFGFELLANPIERVARQLDLGAVS